MEKTTLFFNTHIFCCTNRREEGHPRGCCAEKGADELRDYMKERCKQLGIKRTRVNSAGCLDRCEFGSCLVIYPEGVWYHYANRQDIDEIIEQHILGGKKVERLLLPERGGM